MREQQRELLPAGPRRGAARRRQFPQRRADPHERRVPRVVPERVVQALEVIDIQRHDAQRLAPLRRRDARRQLRFQVTAVEQSRQWVPDGLLQQPVLQAQTRQRQRHLPRHVVQRLTQRARVRVRSRLHADQAQRLPVREQRRAQVPARHARAARHERPVRPGALRLAAPQRPAALGAGREQRLAPRRRREQQVPRRVVLRELPTRARQQVRQRPRQDLRALGDATGRLQRVTQARQLTQPRVAGRECLRRAGRRFPRLLHAARHAVERPRQLAVLAWPPFRDGRPTLIRQSPRAAPQLREWSGQQPRREQRDPHAEQQQRHRRAHQHPAQVTQLRLRAGVHVPQLPPE